MAIKIERCETVPHFFRVIGTPEELRNWKIQNAKEWGRGNPRALSRQEVVLISPRPVETM